tara:strand:- start:92 stop:1450 length:1359 start_codon:yes stop_codon:yes gene_type:complete
VAEDKRWWKRDKDSDTSKEDVEDMLNEAEAKRLQREEELAEAEHREKMSKFSKTESQESDHGSTEEFDGQRIVLKPDRHGNFFVKGSIGNIANINFLVDTGASFCSVKDETARMLNLDWREKIETSTAAGKGMGFRTTLPDVTIGQTSIKNVDALINPLSESGYEILGMSFLKQIEWEHDDGKLILNPEGSKSGGGGSEHWLLEDPGYTVAAIVLALTLIATAFMAVAAGGTKDQWVEIEAEVLEKYPGYDWVLHEDCYTDDWGDEWCDEDWYTLDCWADLDVSYSVDNTTYSSEVDHFPITIYQDYEGAEDDCLNYAENGTMPIGSFVTLYYNTEEPSEVRVDPPWDEIFGLFFCGIIQLILLIVVLVIAYLDVGGNNVRFSSDGDRYYDEPGYYDRPWHRRPWFHRRRRYYRHRSSGSHSRTSRVTRSSGGRKGGGRSGGGRSGGGGRGR